MRRKRGSPSTVDDGGRQRIEGGEEGTIECPLLRVPLAVKTEEKDEERGERELLGAHMHRTWSFKKRKGKESRPTQGKKNKKKRRELDAGLG